MKRSLLISIFLLLLFLIPSQVFALSCVELNVSYFLACKDGICDGFKIREEYKGGGCQSIPYVVELEDEGQQIYHHLSSTTGQIESDGLWKINMGWSCSFAFLGNSSGESDEQRISEGCGEQGKRISINKLSENPTQESLQALRNRAEKDAHRARVSFYASQWSGGTITVFLGAVLPLIVIVRYLTTQNKTLIPYVVFMLFVQMGIIVYLFNLSATFSFVWATSSLAIITPLFLIGIGLIIGAKLANRGHQIPS